MELLIGLAAVLMAVAGFCVYYWVPMGDSEKCRIIRKNGKETGEVRDTGGFVLPFNGTFSDYVETKRRFRVSIPDFLVGFPNEEGATTSLTLTFEVANGGGKAFIRKGGQDDLSEESAKIAKAKVLNFCQSTKEGPMTLDEAQKAPEECILRVADAFADDQLVVTAAGMSADQRKKFASDVMECLANAEGEYLVSRFGTNLVGITMTNFVESTKVTEAKESKKAAAIRLEEEKEATRAIREQMNTLTDGFPNVSFEDATAALGMWKGKSTFSHNRKVVRLETSDPSGAPMGTVDKLIAGAIAAFQENNGNQDKGKGGGKK